MIFVILVTATASLSLAVTVRRMADEPFDRLMGESNGAHLWFVAGPGVDLGSLAGMDGVESTAGPFAVATVGLAGKDGPTMPGFGLRVMAQPVEAPATGRPLVERGRWLEAANEVVLDPDFFYFLPSGRRIGTGDQLQFQGPDGPVVLDVVGTAVNVVS